MYCHRRIVSQVCAKESNQIYHGKCSANNSTYNTINREVLGLNMKCRVDKIKKSVLNWPVVKKLRIVYL